MKLNLRALIRLAVNNANEAEAGRAAIKVCKALLEKDKTILNAENDEEGPTPSAPPPKKEATIKVHHDVRNKDFHIVVTDLDVVANPRIAKILEELDREVRNKPRPEPPVYQSPFRTGSYWDTGWDFGFGESRSERRRRERDARNQSTTSPPPTPEDYATGRARPYDPANPDNYSKTRPPRDLKCTKCGNTFSTQFVGPPQVFECADCAYGDMFDRHKNASTKKG